MKSTPYQFLTVVVLLSAFAAGQQATTPAPSPDAPATRPDAPATREDIQRLFDAMHVQEQIRSTMEVMMTQQRRMIGEMMRKRNRRVTDEEIDKVGDSAQEFLKNFPLGEMVEDMIPVYQKHLTKSDVDAMATFYSSPTGQKLVREQAAMAGESMQAVSARVRRALELAMDRAEQKAKEDEEREKSPPAQTPEQRKN
jgi:hypothetical protein